MATSTLDKAVDMPPTTIAQLTLLKLKPDSHLDEVGSPAGDALLDVISGIKKIDDSNRVFFGRQLENPDIGVLAIGESKCRGLRSHISAAGSRTIVADTDAYILSSQPIPRRRGYLLHGFGAQTVSLQPFGNIPHDRVLVS